MVLLLLVVTVVMVTALLLLFGVVDAIRCDHGNDRCSGSVLLPLY